MQATESQYVHELIRKHDGDKGSQVKAQPFSCDSTKVWKRKGKNVRASARLVHMAAVIRSASGGASFDSRSKKEGYLRKQSKSLLMDMWQRRWFSASGRYLTYSKTPTHPVKSAIDLDLVLIIVDHADVSQMVLLAMPENGYSSAQEDVTYLHSMSQASGSRSSPQTSMRLKAQNPQEALAWVKILHSLQRETAKGAMRFEKQKNAVDRVLDQGCDSEKWQQLTVQDFAVALSEHMSTILLPSHQRHEGALRPFANTSCQLSVPCIEEYDCGEITSFRNPSALLEPSIILDYMKRLDKLAEISNNEVLSRAELVDLILERIGYVLGGVDAAKIKKKHTQDCESLMISEGFVAQNEDRNWISKRRIQV